MNKLPYIVQRECLANCRIKSRKFGYHVKVRQSTDDLSNLPSFPAAKHSRYMVAVMLEKFVVNRL